MSDVRINAEVLGLNDLMQKLGKLKEVDRNRYTEIGLANASRVLIQGAKTRLTQRLLRHGKQTGNLLRSVTFRIKKNGSGAIVGFRVGVRGGNHAHLVDLGTAPRYTKRGEYRGIMPANRFFTDTKAQDSQKALEELKSGIANAIRLGI